MHQRAELVSQLLFVRGGYIRPNHVIYHRPVSQQASLTARTAHGTDTIAGQTAEDMYNL